MVLLTEDRWLHVLRKHGELTPSRSLVLNTVRHPNLVMRDARHATRRCCYAFLPGSDKKIKVVVEYSDEGDLAQGTIVIAYLTERIPPAEVQQRP